MYGAPRTGVVAASGGASGGRAGGETGGRLNFTAGVNGRLSLAVNGRGKELSGKRGSGIDSAVAVQAAMS